MAKAAVVCRRNRVPLAVAGVTPDLAQSSPRSLVELCCLCHSQSSQRSVTKALIACATATFPVAGPARRQALDRANPIAAHYAQELSLSLSVIVTMPLAVAEPKRHFA